MRIRSLASPRCGIPRFLALVALVAACQGAPAETDDTSPIVTVTDSGLDYFPAAQWQTITPAQAGFDTTRVRKFLADLTSGRFGTVDGVAVVRFGRLAIEKYNGWSPTVPHTMQSVSKSVTSLLFGITAAEKGGNADLDRPVLEVFERYATIADVDARKRALTLRHLLQMRTAMDFWEQPYAGSPLDMLNRSTNDWVKFVLDRPMVGAPGSVWSYNSGAAIVMCGVIRELTGEDVAAYARRKLFAPIGVTDERWVTSPYDDLPHCGGGLYLKPVDLARVGYLVLRKGRWGDQQVVPADWLDASTTSYSQGDPVYFSNYNSGYGYFWWLFPVARGGSDKGVIAASGSGGQWLFVVPSLDLVVAVVASNGYGLDLLYDGVLAAIRR